MASFDDDGAVHTLQVVSCGLLLGWAAVASGATPGADLRLSVDSLWLGATPALHGFTESVELGAVRDRQLFGFTLEVGTSTADGGPLGMVWFGLSYAFGSDWTVSVRRKHAPASSARLLPSASAHLLIVRLPAPRLQLRWKRLSLLLHATLGARAGSVAEAGAGASPMELMLPVRAAVSCKLVDRVALEAGAELMHSLATGSPSGIASLGLRWSL